MEPKFKTTFSRVVEMILARNRSLQDKISTFSS